MPTLDSIVRAMTYGPTLGTENELGLHLADVMGGRANAVFDRGQFRRWDPAAPGWVHVPDDEVHRAAAAYEGKKYRVPERPMTECTIRLSAGKVKGIVAQAAVELAQPGFFNEAAQGAGFRNGVARVDGNKIAWESHSPDHRIYAEHVLPFDIMPLNVAKAAMPTFLRFVSEIWAGCADLKERVVYLGEYLGAAMLRQTWRHKDNPIFVGAKDTGKSVMLSTVRAIFPPGTVTCVTLQAMGERFGLSPLIGASVNVVTELPAAALTASEKAKGLLVGDEVMVEEKYKTPFPFRCTCGHLFAANEVPHVPDDALRERFVVLDFPNVVPGPLQDKLLPDKLAAEAQAIASWAVQVAALGVIARGRFVRPPSAAALARGWANQSDNVAAWAVETVAPGTDADFVATVDLYASYTMWCVGRGEKPEARAVFGRRMTRAGFVGKNRGGRGYLVRYLTDAEREAARRWQP
jgi:P4 family phage/plasmid primase-like protien